MAKSYRTKRKHSPMGGVTFTAGAVAENLPCQCCGGQVESAPMIKNICYDCYRKIIAGEIPDPRKTSEESAYTAMDQILGTEPATQRQMESMVELFTDKNDPRPNC